MIRTLAIALIAIATLPVQAAAPLTVNQLTDAARHNTIPKVVGKQVTLTLSKTSRNHLYAVEGDPGLIALCPVNARFAGGQITAKLISFDLETDIGGEDANVVKLDSCK